MLIYYASANSEFNAFSPIVPSMDVSNGISDQNRPYLLNSVGGEAQPQVMSGPNLSSSADDTPLQTNIQSPCAVGSNGKARNRRDGEVCRPQVEKKPTNLPLNIYDPLEVMDSLEKLNLQDDFIDWNSIEEFQKKQDQYRAWNDFLTDDNPNKCKNLENPFYDIHVCCKGPFGYYNGLFFDWAEGCSLRTFSCFLHFKKQN